MPFSTPKHKSGFTLVELSVVLVIIGLIAGGVTVGSSLIRAAELRAIIREKEELQVAINVFRNKYRYLPGDMPTASTVFSGTNGDGDGITYLQGNGAGNIHENLKAWQHLTLSGILPGSYPGTTPGVISTPGTNIPVSRFGGGKGGWEFLSFNNTYHYGRNEHTLLLGTNSSTNSDIADDAIISPNDAQQLDVKLDDGIAYKGLIVTGNGDNTTGCTSNAWTAPSNYNNSESKLCRMFFYGIIPQ